MPQSNKNRKKIAIIGFGYVGAVLGAVLADRGLMVSGIDADENIVRLVNAGSAPLSEPGLDSLIAAGVAAGRLRASCDMAAAEGADVVIITVGTPLDGDGSADMSQLDAAIDGISPHLGEGQLLILKSTVPPGTTMDRVWPKVREKGVRLAFCPERLAEGSAVHDLSVIPVVVGGVDDDSRQAAAAFWREALDVEVLEVGNPATAEMVKLADNLWIDLNIALANELAMLSDGLGIDVLEVIMAANSLPKGDTKGDRNVNILKPSIGVGGACLTKDPWFVRALGKEHGLDLQTPRVSRQINDAVPAFWAAVIERELAGKEGPVAVLGLAFKTNTGDCRETPAAPAIRALRDMGREVRVFDPWVGAEEAERVAGTAPAEDIGAAIKGASCVAFFTGHDQFRDYPLEKLAELAGPGALVFDGRMYFDRVDIEKIEALGLRFKGVGR